MASNTSLLSVDAVDTALTLNEFISHFSVSDGAVFAAECKGFVDGAQTEQLIAKYLEHTDEIFSLDNEKGIALYNL